MRWKGGHRCLSADGCGLCCGCACVKSTRALLHRIAVRLGLSLMCKGCARSGAGNCAFLDFVRSPFPYTLPPA
eukprot:1848318-Pleurochrysis_carterae.AAC.1